MTASRFIVRLALAGALSPTVMAHSAAPRKRLLVIGKGFIGIHSAQPPLIPGCAAAAGLRVE